MCMDSSRRTEEGNKECQCLALDILLQNVVKGKCKYYSTVKMLAEY